MKKGISMIETLRDFVAKVNELGIEYMVTGSYAMSAFGEIRMARDIDVVNQLTEQDATHFFERFDDDHYISNESIKRAIERRSMFKIISQAHGCKSDRIIRKDTDFARASFAWG